jgi:hypothetical protein
MTGPDILPDRFTLSRRSDPDYTKQAINAKLHGCVALAATFGIDGVPVDIKMVRGLKKGLDEKGRRMPAELAFQTRPWL